MADMDPTYYDLQADCNHRVINPDDLHRILYNLYQAVRAICNNLDEDGTGASDYDSYIRTPLDTAMAKLKTPPQGDTET